jgi:ABC-type amino acid transport substrate-binding protein
VRDLIKMGEFFGVKSALGRYMREETAIVLQDSAVMVFSVPEFEQVASKNTRIIAKMLTVFSNQLRRIHRQVQNLMVSDAQVNSETGLYKIGEYYMKNKRFGQALYAYKRYLVYYPSGAYATDVANKVGQLLNLKVEFKHPAWETVPSVLRKGLCDVSIGSMTDTPEGRRQLAFTDPYYYSRAQAFMRKGGTPLTGSQDLAGKKVGVRAATTYYDYLVQDTSARVTMYDTDAAAFAALEAGVVDYVVSSDVTGQQAISSGQQIAVSGKPLYYESCVFATKKGESDWLALLNYAIGKMHADGSLAAMSRHWFYGTDLTSKD